MVVGMTFGALFGGSLIKIGRRKATFIGGMLCAIGCLITLKLNFYFLIVGRVIYGLGVGIFCSSCPRLIEENLPPHIYETVAASFCFFQTMGTLCAYFLGGLLPNDDDKAALLATEAWHVLYTYFPLGLVAATYIGLFTVIKYESIKFCIL